MLHMEPHDLFRNYKIQQIRAARGATRRTTKTANYKISEIPEIFGCDLFFFGRQPRNSGNSEIPAEIWVEIPEIPEIPAEIPAIPGNSSRDLGRRPKKKKKGSRAKKLKKKVFVVCTL